MAERAFPVAFELHGEPIPELREVPEEDWRAVLAPLSTEARDIALRRVPERFFDADVQTLKLELDLETADRSRARRRTPTPTLPAATATAAGRSAGRQISVRFAGPQYRELVEAADARGLKPSTLARLLIRSGVRRILYEERRDGR